MTALRSYHGLTLTFAALVAFLSAVNLVVGPAQAARLQEDLARRFADRTPIIGEHDKLHRHVPIWITNNFRFHGDHFRFGAIR